MLLQEIGTWNLASKVDPAFHQFYITFEEKEAMFCILGTTSCMRLVGQNTCDTRPM